MIIQYGIVSATQPETGRVRVTLAARDNLATDWLPVIQRHGTKTNKHYGLPDQGEHVACLLDKNCEEGVVLGSIYDLSEDTPDPDNSGAGVYALKLMQAGASVFLAKIVRAASGAFSLWSKSSVKVETDSGNIELAAGKSLKLSSVEKLSIEANGENAYELLLDIMEFLQKHNHVATPQGTPTVVLSPADIPKAAALVVRVKNFLKK